MGNAQQQRMQGSHDDTDNAATECPYHKGGSSSSMMNTNNIEKQQQQQELEKPTTTTTTQECPVKHNKNSEEAYNVYGIKIDPTNMMAPQTNKKIYEDQQTDLNTQRVQSTIKKGGTDSTWLYPSEQMFYNALKRKGKFSDEHAVRAIVAIHNGVNERTWQKIMKWESALHGDMQHEPKLLRFMGKPQDWSIKARWMHYIMQYPAPFDRHDWIVERADKTQQRYIIDYYYVEERAKDEEQVEFNNKGFLIPKKVKIDARVAMDDWQSVQDRCKYWFFKKSGKKEQQSEEEQDDILLYSIVTMD